MPATDKLSGVDFEEVVRSSLAGLERREADLVTLRELASVIAIRYLPVLRSRYDQAAAELRSAGWARDEQTGALIAPNACIGTSFNIESLAREVTGQALKYLTITQSDALSNPMFNLGLNTMSVQLGTDGCVVFDYTNAQVVFGEDNLGEIALRTLNSLFIILDSGSGGHIITHGILGQYVTIVREKGRLVEGLGSCVADSASDIVATTNKIGLGVEDADRGASPARWRSVRDIPPDRSERLQGVFTDLVASLPEANLDPGLLPTDTIELNIGQGVDMLPYIELCNRNTGSFVRVTFLKGLRSGKVRISTRSEVGQEINRHELDLEAAGEFRAVFKFLGGIKEFI